MDNVGLRGSRPRELPRPNRTYGSDRVCSQPECTTRISRYNKAKFCWAHAPVKFPLVRGERKKKRKAA